MKIQYRTQGTGAYTTLGDDTAGNIITGFSPRMSGIPQVTPLFRAAFAQVLARNNRHWELRGVVEIDHGNAAQALEYIQTQAASIPDFIDLQILQDATTLLLSPAVFVALEPLLTGQSSRITYGFVAGNLTLVAGP